MKIYWDQAISLSWVCLKTENDKVTKNWWVYLIFSSTL